jgi:NAD(P)-dependent dehydrogenase (short-subunit alcohol dehydrogenase family)
MSKIFLVIGAGAGVGCSVAARYAAEGYLAVLCRRSDHKGLDRLVADIKSRGGEATGLLLDATLDGAIEDLIEKVESEIGPIDVVLFNLGAQIGDRPLAKTSLKTFELGWRMATFALFRLASALLPRMEERGKGTLLVTSATAAVRGNKGQHSHAAAMGGRRMLCQSLNAEFSPKGVHIAHVIIDGMIDAPDTVGKLLGEERYRAIQEQMGNGKDEILVPAEIANTYFHIARQHRSAWTHELDLRPFTSLPWWNH